MAYNVQPCSQTNTHGKFSTNQIRLLQPRYQTHLHDLDLQGSGVFALDMAECQYTSGITVHDCILTGRILLDIVGLLIIYGLSNWWSEAQIQRAILWIFYGQGILEVPRPETMHKLKL